MYSAILGLFVSCSSPTGPNPYAFRFPLEVGNQWHYAVTLTRTVEETGDIETIDDVQAILTVINVSETGMGTKRYTLMETDVTDGDTTGPSTTYEDRADGLYLVAYDNQPKLQITPKQALPARVTFGGAEFASFGALYDALTDGMVSGGWVAGSAEDVRWLALRYPFKSGASWVYNDSALDGGVVIRKAVTGLDTVTVSAGTFTCVRVEWNYEGLTSAPAFVDYFAPEGLIKRSIVLSGVEEQTYEQPWGEPQVVTYDTEIELISGQSP